jgi:Kelch motif protein
VSWIRAAVLTVVALLALPPLGAAAETSWRQLAAAPGPRQEVTYVALGSAAYLAAGNERSQERFDLLTDTWQPVAPLPPAFEDLDHVGGAALGDTIVYAGGLLQWKYPFPVAGPVTIYDPVTNSFSDGSEMPAPRAAGGVAAWHGLLVYAGGLGPEGSVARVDAYDPASDSWTRLQDLPRPRDHFQLVVADEALYAIGGRVTSEGSHGIRIEDLEAVDRLALPADPANLPSATWSAEVTDLPTPRGGLGVTAVGDCVYAIGGEVAGAAPPGVTGVTQSYDPESGTWRELPSLGTPRHGIEAALSGHTILVAGGGLESFSDSPTAVQEALDVSSQPPCVSTPPETPASGPGGTEIPTASPVLPVARRRSAGGGSTGAGELRITRLSLRPRRVQAGIPAHATLDLSAAGSVLIRVQRAVPTGGPCPVRPRRARCGERWTLTSWSLRRHLKAGRNVVPLRLAPPLPPGRYRLLARALGPNAVPVLVRRGFRLIP